MKIVFLGDIGSNFRTGGGQIFGREFLAIAQKWTNDLIAYIPQSSIDRGTVPKDKNTTIVNIPRGGMGNVWCDLPYAYQVLRHLKKNGIKPDLYLVDQPLALIPHLPNAPLVCMFHGSDFVKGRFDLRHPRSSFYAHLWQKPFLTPIYLGLLNQKLGIPLFNSRYTLRCINDDTGIDVDGLYDNVTYLPLNIDRFEDSIISKKDMRQRLGIDDEEIVLLYLSNFAPKKRSWLAADIAKAVLDMCSGEGIRFMFIGRPIDSKKLDGFVFTEPYRRRCIRIMEIPPDDVVKYYAAADIGFSTSKTETFGYTVAEGMAAGLPHVIFNAGALPEIVDDGESGFVVESEGDFVRRLAQLVQDKGLRRRMGECAREKIRQGFSHKAFETRLRDILADKHPSLFR